MALGLQNIIQFVDELEISVFIRKRVISDTGYCVYTSKFCIYFYLPTAVRLEDDADIATIHIDLDQIVNCSSKLLKRLIGLHGIGERVYARQTVVARIDKKTALNFQGEHHLNESFPGKYRYGLYLDGELVSIAVFSGGRLMREEGDSYRSFELIRFCHKGGVLVIGGLSKLLKAFVKDFHPQDIMTYADLDWTQHSSLEAVGFKVMNTIGPQEFYIIDGIRKSRLTEADIEYYKVLNKGSLKLKLFL